NWILARLRSGEPPKFSPAPAKPALLSAPPEKTFRLPRLRAGAHLTFLGSHGGVSRESQVRHRARSGYGSVGEFTAEPSAAEKCQTHYDTIQAQGDLLSPAQRTNDF